MFIITLRSKFDGKVVGYLRSSDPRDRWTTDPKMRFNFWLRAAAEGALERVRAEEPDKAELMNVEST